MFHKRKEENILRVFEKFREMEIDFKVQDMLHKRKEEKMLRVSEQFRAIENDVSIHERLIEKLTLEIKKSLHEISEIVSEPKDLHLHREIDVDGDEDILKISFGGSNVDIKRSILTKPRCGWNAFSCLFQKRWDRFHVRDRKGRIYVDLKEEWMRPLLEYMKDSDSSNKYLSASNRSIFQMINYFGMEFMYGGDALDFGTTLSGLETSRIGASCTTERQKADFRLTVCEVCRQLEDAPHFDFQLLYTLSSDDKTIPPIPENVDYRFKSFLIVVQLNGSFLMYFHNTNQIKSRNKKRGSSGNRFTFMDFFPLRPDEEKQIEIHFRPGNQQNYERFEIYEVRFSYEKLNIAQPQPRPVEDEKDFDEMSSLSASEYDETERFRRLGNPDELLECASEYKKSLVRESDSLRYKSYQLDKEIRRMSIYFHSTWSRAGPKSAWTTMHLLDLLKNVVNIKQMYEAAPHNRKRRRSKGDEEMLDMIDTNALDPIVYFNVEGEIFTILRSTILRVIPKSQLAVRVSGRWEEQTEKGEIDEEGNLIVNCHKESFRQIISALQTTCFGEDFHVLVNSLCRNAIEKTLNFLVITPKLLIYADSHF
jgi:hypothetical protein